MQSLGEEIRARWLVSFGFFQRLLNNEHFKRTAARFQFQAQLLLYGGE